MREMRIIPADDTISELETKAREYDCAAEDQPQPSVTKPERAGNYLQGVGCGVEIERVDFVVRMLCSGRDAS